MDCSGVCENAHIGQIGYQEIPQTSTKSGIAVDSSKNQSAAKQKQVEKRAVMTNHREKGAHWHSIPALELLEKKAERVQFLFCSCSDSFGCCSNYSGSGGAGHGAAAALPPQLLCTCLWGAASGVRITISQVSCGKL